MIELVTHMWIALVGAAMAGLLIGWALRGLTRKAAPRAKTPVQPKPMAQERQTLRADDVRIAVARGAKAEKDLSSAQNQLLVANKQIRFLQQETGRLKQRLGIAHEAPVAENEELTALEQDEERTRLVWRNRYLESRVRHLQAAQNDADPVNDLTDQDDAQKAKLEWQVRYLEKRIADFEKNDLDLEAAPAGVPLDQPPVTRAASEETDDTLPDEPEIARLRWRNRYLESRLKYIEGKEADTTA